MEHDLAINRLSSQCIAIESNCYKELQLQHNRFLQRNVAISHTCSSARLVPSLISHLSRAEQRKLLDDLNYLNIAEFRAFCDAHEIPYVIYVETADGKQKRTRETDRKAIVLDRIRSYLKTGRTPPATCLAPDVVSTDLPPQTFKPTQRLYFGWYNKRDTALMAALRKLTDGEFKDGAIARILLRKLWTAGTAPTLREFAAAWQAAAERGLGEHPEAAWLTDRARKTAGKDWKAKRTRIANGVLKTLSAIPARSAM